MSYDLVEEQEQLDSIGSVSSKLFLFERRYDRLRHNEIPLSSVDDLRSYIHSSISHLHESDAISDNLYFEGTGRRTSTTAYGEGDGGSIRLEGKTEASFDNSFKTAGVKMQESEGCSCMEDTCVRARGTLNARYSARTTVTLPSVSDYPDLSLPQKKRLQKAITTVLAPHEQKHVAAFRKYNGTTSRKFDLTVCKGEFDSTIQSMFDEEEAERRDAVQAESDALDPFFFDFEL